MQLTISFSAISLLGNCTLDSASSLAFAVFPAADFLV